MSYAEAQERIKKCREERATSLDLAGLDLFELPTELFELKQLTELQLGGAFGAGNQLASLSESITLLENLHILSLDNNELSILPESIGSLAKLQHLTLDNNKLSDLPESISHLVQLQHLSIDNNKLSDLPESITRLESLELLSLDNNQLSTLPESISRLTELQFLILHDNYLHNLPDSLPCLTKLQELYLSNNKLSVIPEVITHLKNLVILHLDNNQLYSIPDSISQLTRLQRLSLSNNLLSTLPQSITQLTQLQILSLANNQLRELPEPITNLKQLYALYLADNQLSNLPATITHLVNLRVLSLSDNNLHALPESITNLPNLKILSIANNRLNDLPKSLIRLTQLQSLILDNNRLSVLPKFLIYLKNLDILSTQNNPLLYPPEPIAARGIEAVRNYLEKFGEPDHLYEAKLLLVGEGRVGKTSLAKTLALPGYRLAEESSTEGIDIHTWIIPKEELGTEKDFRLNVWDFGGQEIYHATHQFFLTRRSLYLLVTESRKEDKHEDFYYWLNIIRLLGDKSPVLLVLNKCDQPTKELPFNEYRQRFSALSDYLKVSCEVGFEAKIEDLRQTIYRVLRDPKLMAHIGAPLPKVWVTVREEIEQLRLAGRNHISRDEYMAICTQHEVDEVTAGVLGDYFHDLGIFLYFRDDIELEETIFLNYAWVTDAVYKVLDNSGVKARYGRFSPANLQEIWGDSKYRSKRRELLALMKNRKFELCYELPNGDYLAPQLLPVDEQPYAWRSPNENLHFEYRYEFMPKGILSRFIVKRHQDIFQQTHWRYGVLLEWANTRALVRERYFDRKLTIVLEGQNKRDFLQIIRKSVEEIHDSFKNLEVAEMVPCNCTDCQKSESPHFYKHELLDRYRQKGIRSIRCEKSLDDVDVQRLINDVFPPPPRERFGEEDESDWREEILRRGGTYIDTQIVTGGGSVIQGDANIGGNLVGRDQHLT